MAVSPELHSAVLVRDQYCFLRRLDATHQCRDAWGVRHASDDLNKLTVDHVWPIAGGVRGKRAPDREDCLVALCADANIRGPSRLVRQAQREYLRRLYPVES